MNTSLDKKRVRGMVRTALRRDHLLPALQAFTDEETPAGAFARWLVTGQEPKVPAEMTAATWKFLKEQAREVALDLTGAALTQQTFFRFEERENPAAFASIGQWPDRLPSSLKELLAANLMSTRHLAAVTPWSWAWSRDPRTARVIDGSDTFGDPWLMETPSAWLTSDPAIRQGGMRAYLLHALAFAVALKLVRVPKARWVPFVRFLTEADAMYPNRRGVHSIDARTIMAMKPFKLEGWRDGDLLQVLDLYPEAAQILGTRGVIPKDPLPKDLLGQWQRGVLTRVEVGELYDDAQRIRTERDPVVRMALDLAHSAHEAHDPADPFGDGRVKPWRVLTADVAIKPPTAAQYVEFLQRSA